MKTMRTVPACKALRPWLKANDVNTASLTGQDSKALDAFVHILELYAYSDDDGRDAALKAMSSVVLAMQRSTRHIAKRAIPHVLDWADEERIWSKIGGDDGLGIRSPRSAG